MEQDRASSLRLDQPELARQAACQLRRDPQVDCRHHDRSWAEGAVPIRPYFRRSRGCARRSAMALSTQDYQRGEACGGDYRVQLQKEAAAVVQPMTFHHVRHSKIGAAHQDWLNG